MISLRLNGQKSNQENELKNCESEVMISNITEIKKISLRPMNTTQRINKNLENFRVVARSGDNALNFYHIFHLN